MNALKSVRFVDVVCDFLRVSKGLKLLNRKARPRIFLLEGSFNGPFNKRANFCVEVYSAVGMGYWLEHAEFNPCHREGELTQIAFR